MFDVPTKICSFCGVPKTLSEMDTTVKNGVTYYRSRCKSCLKERRSVWRAEHPEEYRKQRKAREARDSQDRRDNRDTAKFILRDSKGSDRKRGLNNNLTLQDVSDFLSRGCFYCGATDLRMTLDRVDNQQGHLIGNVVPACIRCNYTRRDMPYEAWLVVAQGMKNAREQNLFGSWVGRIKIQGLVDTSTE
jgi:hypothetical protein